MSFTRFRKAEKSKASSVQSNQDYRDSMRQQDNLSQYSRRSQDKYDYQPRTQNPPQQKISNQPQTYQKYKNDINNLQRSEHNSQNPSMSSSSSTADQYICNNCINDALIYEKQLNSRGNDYPNGENPLDIQDRLGALQRAQINNKINERQGRAQEAGKHLGEPTNKDKFIQQNDISPFRWKGVPRGTGRGMGITPSHSVRHPFLERRGTQSAVIPRKRGISAVL